MSKKNPPVLLSLVNQAELLFKLEQLSTHIFLLRQLNTDESFLKDLLEIVDSYITKITNTHNFVEQFEFSFFDAPSANLQPADNPFQDISIEPAPYRFLHDGSMDPLWDIDAGSVMPIVDWVKSNLLEPEDRNQKNKMKYEDIVLAVIIVKTLLVIYYIIVTNNCQ